MSRIAAILIPTLNEEARIGGLLEQLSRLPATMVTDILVADGRSTDGTRAIVTKVATRDPRIRLVDNPDRLQAAGINRAAALADPRADTLVRIDAHARYPYNYVPAILSTFDETGADMVATRLVTVGETCLQRGIAAAQNSRAGMGGSAHRAGGYTGWIDHGHHAGMDRVMFKRVGGYDPSFAANEDAELDLRIRRAGGRIWLAGTIESVYFPRRSLGALARQFRKYGEGRARTFLKHGERLRARQVLPPLLLIGMALSIMLAPLTPLLLLLPLLYLAALSVITAGLARKQPEICTLAAFPAMVIMHLAWGWGFSVTLARGGQTRIRQPGGATSVGFRANAEAAE